MNRTFTRDEVLRLAPDSGSAKSGQDLAQLRKWGLLEGDEAALWGECQGSGAKPYRVQIDLAEPAFKCSCPSRKFPCKHGLGLLLLFATTAEAFVAAQRPAWVQEWLASREARATKAAEKQSSEPKLRDTAAQTKRREKRIDRARAGLADLSAWMHDLVRSGIGSAPTKGFEFFDGQARRLVDAQATGAARLVRQLGSTASSGANWQQPFLEQLSLLHLLSQAVERFDEVSDTVRADVEAVLGITTAAEALAELPAVADSWQVIAQEVELDDRIRVQRTWMYGTTVNRAALVLQFAHGTSGFDAMPPPGAEFTGELVFYPGSGGRAAVRHSSAAIQPITALVGMTSLAAFLDRFSQVIADFPWLERICLPLSRVIPTRVDDRWWVIDASGAALSMRLRDDLGFTLLAVSGGHAVDIAAEFDGKVLRPLAVVADGVWTSLAAEMVEMATP
jgi:hypothetical protein